MKPICGFCDVEYSHCKTQWDSEPCKNFNLKDSLRFENRKSKNDSISKVFKERYP